MILKLFKFSYQFKLPPSTSEFHDFVQTGFYVDKTQFIQEVLIEDRFAPFITRPRRWGKSLNLNMLYCFFQPNGWPKFDGTRMLPLDLSQGNIHRKLFQGGGDQNLQPLKIAQLKDTNGASIIEKYQGQCPIIRLKFSYLYGNTKEIQQKNFLNMVQQAYEDHRYLYLNLLVKQMEDNIQECWKNQKKIKEWKKKKWITEDSLNMQQILIDFEYNYEEIISILQNIVINSSNKFEFYDLRQKYLAANFQQQSTEDVQKSLITLIKELHQYFNRKVIILIDEFDSPSIQYWDEEIDQYLQGRQVNYQLKKGHNNLIRSIMINLLKDDQVTPMIQKCIIFGTTDIVIKKDSSFNNVSLFDIEKTQLSSSFAFTDPEIDQLITSLIKNLKIYANLDIQDQKTKIKDYIIQWYNGYNVGDLKLYCPFSVMNYLALIKDQYPVSHIIPKPQNFWTESGVNFLIHKIQQLATGQLFIEKFQKMIETGIVELYIYRPRTYPETVEEFQNNHCLLTYMLINTGYITRIPGQQELFKIPNREVEEYFLGKLSILSLQMILPTKDETILYGFLKDFFDYFTKSADIFQQYVQKDMIDKWVEGTVKEISLQTLFQSIFTFSKYHRTHQAYIECGGSFKKKIDHLFLPENNENPIIIHEYKKVESLQHVASKQDECLWQVYGNCYMHKILSEINSSYNQQSQSIIDTQGHWRVNIMEIAHSINQANQITKLFLIDNLPFNNYDSKNTAEGKKSFLKNNSVKSIEDLIQKFGTVTRGEMEKN